MVHENNVPFSSLADDGRPKLGLIKRTMVVLHKDAAEIQKLADKLANTNVAAILVGTRSWKQQFSEAVTIGIGYDKVPTSVYIMHLVTLPWKLLFATVPPTALWNGWACFFVSIVMIGLLTALIGDLAVHFGCTCGLKDSVTGLSVVALGTSVPEMFASRLAAIMSEHADASIAHITGGNSMNVFLGIGVAWAMASIYHAANGTQFEVTPGALAFAVTQFCIFALFCIAILQIRRCWPKIYGELGGPHDLKYATGILLIFLWFLYLLLGTLEAYCIIDPGL